MKSQSTIFVKEGPDKRGRTYIIEGEELQNGSHLQFNIKRFICEVQKQESEEETQKLADFILEKLN